MLKKLLILFMLCSSLFSEDIRELTDENFDVKIYRINIELYPGIQGDNDVVILPTIIFYDDGEEAERLQGDMSFSLETTIEALDEIVEEILSSKF